jgi:4-diphosphocytidyl-2-C-methyl-D-erythritol kinase
MKVKAETMFAYAKVNLALAITGRRPDGYHELQSVMQTVSLHDIVEITLGGKEITCYCGDLSGASNLAYRAAAVFREYGGYSEGITINIIKNIPVEAGLAGGSSDAAAVLRGLNRLYGERFSAEEIRKMGALLGSDVVYSLQGGTAWVTGRGEKLEKLPELPAMDMVIVKPDKGVNTGQAYRLFDEGRYEGRQLNRREWERAALAGKVYIAGLLMNDLEQVSIALVPEIGVLKQKLCSYGCLGALMSGSGSAVFGIAPAAADAAAIAANLRSEGYQAWQTTTVTGYT